MKNQIIVAIADRLAIALEIQIYMMFQLNDRLNQLSGQKNEAGSSQIKILKLPKLTIPNRIWMTSYLMMANGTPTKKCSVCKVKWNSFSAIHFRVFI